ncbi:hypothetical protein L3X38_018300 [Prunus dulcis]|uniref:Uncharacterized protein n=1 Tax=Prunus dulcis TaxID=3755 RepID=A0AAD4W9R8_PRUDU|nr:hypothetical protein L3X38_018300 [Prunus dulcis]
MSAARSQVPSVISSPAQERQKRRAEDHVPQDTRKRREEDEPMRDTGKRPMGFATLEGPGKVSVDPIGCPLLPWTDRAVALGAYQKAVKRILKVNVVVGLFTEGMSYSGMTMFALEDQLKVSILASQTNLFCTRSSSSNYCFGAGNHEAVYTAQNVVVHCQFERGKKDEQAVTVAKLKRMVGEKAKVEEKLEQMRGCLEEEEKKNTELASSLGKLREEKRGLSQEPSVVQKSLVKQKIEAFTSELRSCYDSAIKNFMDSAEYPEKLIAQRVEGYFDLIEKVGEKYLALDWSFLIDEAGEFEAEQGGGIIAQSTEAVTESARLAAPGIDVGATSAEPVASIGSIIKEVEAIVASADPAGDSIEVAVVYL